jgi:hypothetical protein
LKEDSKEYNVDVLHFSCHDRLNVADPSYSEFMPNEEVPAAREIFDLTRKLELVIIIAFWGWIESKTFFLGEIS